MAKVNNRVKFFNGLQHDVKDEQENHPMEEVTFWNFFVIK